MFLEKCDGKDTISMSLQEKMNLILETMESKGSLFISCIHCNIPINEAEEWYKNGEIGDQDFINFYDDVNLIEESFGFEIYKKSEYPTLHTQSINQIASTYPMNRTQNEKTPLFLRRERKLYEITNIFKSHSTNEIFISMDSKSKPKHEIKYDFTLKELNEIFKNYLEEDCSIYILNDNRAFVMTLGHFQFEFDVFGSAKESYVFDVEIDDEKYDKIFIRSSYYFNIPVDELDGLAKILKQKRIIEEGFFEGQFLYHTPGNGMTYGDPIRIIENEIEKYAFRFITF